MKPLSKRQLELLEAIRSFAADTRRMPSVREMATRLGRAPSTIQQHINSLCKKGLLERDGSAYGLRLVEPDESEAGAAEMIEVPLKGTIAAGGPIEAIEVPEDPLLLPVSLVPAGSYALKVQGSSMVDSHILDGDIVIVREQSEIENGAIAVALLPDGSATLKRLYRDGGRVRLQPANPSMAPTWAESVRVQGKVVGVLRRFEQERPVSRS